MKTRFVVTAAVFSLGSLFSLSVAAQQVIPLDHHSSRFQCWANGSSFMVTHGCGWEAITPETLAAPYAVQKHKMAGATYRRYSVIVAGRRLMLATSNSDAPGTHYSAERWAEDVGKVVAQLPPFVHVLLPESFAIVDWDHAAYARFCTVDVHGCVGPVVAAHTIHMPASEYSSGQIARSDEMLHVDYANVLLHEIGHAFYFLVPGWWDETLWREAAEADGAFVTDYADWDWGGIEEDFAESFGAWAMLRGYGANLAPDVRERIESIGNRLTYFDTRLRESMHSHRPVGLGPHGD